MPIYVGGASLLAVLFNRAISGIAPVADASRYSIISMMMMEMQAGYIIEKIKEIVALLFLEFIKYNVSKKKILKIIFK